MRTSEIKGALNAACSAMHVLPMAAARTAEYQDLMGERAEKVYDASIADLETVVKEARKAIRELKALRNHTHNFDTGHCGYCSLCGADGAA